MSAGQTASDTLVGGAVGALLGAATDGATLALGAVQSIVGQLLSGQLPGTYATLTYQSTTLPDGSSVSSESGVWLTYAPNPNETGGEQGFTQYTSFNADGSTTTTTWNADGTSNSVYNPPPGGGSGHPVPTADSNGYLNAPGTVAGSAGAWDDQYASQWNAETA